MLKTRLSKTQAKKVMSFDVPDFAQKNKNLLVIVCDPKTDMIFVGKGGEMVLGRIKSADGKQMSVVKNVLDNSQFKTAVNPFIVALLEALQLPMKAGNLFYQFIDGALFNISKALARKKKPGAVVSPFVSELEGRAKH
jgi:hypothetical protein